jgi:hypothetical protein
MLVGMPRRGLRSVYQPPTTNSSSRRSQAKAGSTLSPSTINYQLSTKRARPAPRGTLRRAPRSCLRRATRRTTRHVLPDRGPSLRSLFAQCNRCLREIDRLHRKLNPPSHFKTLGTPEELRRQMEADLQRAYGDQSPSARHHHISAAPPAASSPPTQPPAAVVPLSPSPGPDSQPSTINPRPISKFDVMAVPMVRSPNGTLTLDWSAARPA